jgi:predicted enzyme related to lactoylglutathione lyase
MVDDVDRVVDFYIEQFGFELGQNASPAFAEVVRGRLRQLLAGPESSAGRPMPDGRRPVPGGWNRIHFVVDDIEAEITRLREARATAIGTPPSLTTDADGVRRQRAGPSILSSW